jgi:hypothetical protein
MEWGRFKDGANAGLVVKISAKDRDGDCWVLMPGGRMNCFSASALEPVSHPCKLMVFEEVPIGQAFYAPEDDALLVKIYSRHDAGEPLASEDMDSDEARAVMIAHPPAGKRLVGGSSWIDVGDVTVHNPKRVVRMLVDDPSEADNFGPLEYAS